MPTTRKNTLAQTAAAALNLAHEREAEIQAALPEFHPQMREEEDDDVRNEEAPMLQEMYSKEGNQSLLAVTNFTLVELDELWSKIRDVILTKWNVGRGRRSKHTAKDVFVMLLAVMKQGDAWDIMARAFNMTALQFKKLITNYAYLVAEHLFTVLVTDIAAEYTMFQLKVQNETFETHPSARYALDVRFQESNRPTGNHGECLSWYSKKHSAYGMKHEVAVLPSGLAIYSSGVYKGSAADITIMMNNMQQHKK